MKQQEKTHWLSNPNKNYLGHWDLPNGEDLTLTIKSAAWEEVKNPILNTKEAKRVIRFNENFKPMICNQTNAKSIMKVTNLNFMEDAVGSAITLFIDTTIDKKTKERIDCIRVRPFVKEVKPVQKTILDDNQYARMITAIAKGNLNKQDAKLNYQLSKDQEKEVDSIKVKAEA